MGSGEMSNPFAAAPPPHPSVELLPIKTAVRAQSEGVSCSV